MSKLGDILKELFPLREMGNQMFGQNRVDSMANFGKGLIDSIRSLNSQTIHQALQSGQRRLERFSDRGGVPGSIARFLGVPGNPFGRNTPAPLPGFKEFRASQGTPGTGAKIDTTDMGRQFDKAGTSASRLSQSFDNLRGHVDKPQDQEKSAGGIGKVFDTVKRGFGTFGKTLESVTDTLLRIGGLRFVIGQLADDFTNSNRELSRWNGAIASSFAKLDIARMQLDIQQGKATSGTSSQLNESIVDLMREFQPIREGLSNVANIVKTKVVQVTTEVVKIVKGVEEIVGWLGIVAKEAEAANKQNQNKNAPLGNQVLGQLRNLERLALGEVPKPEAKGAPLPVVVDRRFIPQGVDNLPKFFLHRGNNKK